MPYSAFFIKKKGRLILICCVLLCGVTLIVRANKTRHTISSRTHVIAIDPGHGGDDPGKIGINHALEKDINLSIANMLAIYLKTCGFSVILTRNSDCMLGNADASGKKSADMRERIRRIGDAGAELVISIHQNSYPAEAVHGAQCFYYADSENGKRLAGLLQAQLISGLDTSNKRAAKADASYYMLRKSPAPAVIVECGFLSNEKEAEQLCNPEYQQKIAFCLFMGIMEYYQ